jgi:hypothetical protein
MGHYCCPRCNGLDSYVGNVVVIEKSGIALTQEVGESGVYASAQTGGNSRTVQAVKCKKCGEILSSENYVKSEEEAKRDADDEFWATFWAWFIGIFIFVGVISCKALVKG